MKNLYRKIVSLAYKSKEGHIASSLSILDILDVLYKDKIIKTSDDDRNRFVLSKGHGSLALYVILHKYGFLSDEELDSYCLFSSNIGGHPKRNPEIGIEASTGSLGHGIGIATGLALAYKIKKYNSHIYTLIGDGELNEGSVWESLLLANHHKLNNLTIIVDYNHSNDRALKYNDIKFQFKSFGFDCFSMNGHNHYTIQNVLKRESDKPIAIIANTIKGNGVKRMENSPHEWHHRCPTSEEFDEIMEEL